MRTLSLAAAAALTLSMGVAADAADLRRPVYKAPPPAPAPVASWTGCYVGIGGGYGMSNSETSLITATPFAGFPAGTVYVDGITQGGRGWLATAQIGCDYQFAGPIGNWLIGVFADYDWTNIKGRHTGGSQNIGLQQGSEKLRNAWSVGGRLGWLVGPQLLTYVSGGYTEASFGAVDYNLNILPGIGNATGLQLPGRTHQGWFIGSGVEYAIGWLPGLFWKNEYRLADYRAQTERVNCISAVCGGAGPTAFTERNHPYVQTVRTELVWRFNTGAPAVAARY